MLKTAIIGGTDGRRALFFPPMVQLGKNGRIDCVDIVFLARREATGLTLEASSPRGPLAVSELVRTEIAFHPAPAHDRFIATISGLQPAESFRYRIRQRGRLIFESECKSRPAPGSKRPVRMALTGDMGNGSMESSRVAHQIWKRNPELIGFTGDVAYMHGRILEYFRRFLPVYNSECVDQNFGVPLLCQVLSFACAGNHCVGRMEYFDSPSFDQFADLFAHFLYWSLPLNGPLADARARANIPTYRGNQARARRFLKAAGECFPRIANFSFDFGNVHWLVLDGNGYMDWTNADLRAWVEKDLSSSTSRWKLVMFHQPGFTSNPKHKHEKRMRLLCDIFQRHGVDVVFSGHVHYYERTYPLTFTVEPLVDGRLIDSKGQVQGKFAIDESFDGVTNTCPSGIIYIVTGAGGAKLDPAGLQWQKGLWKPFTHKVIGDRHSFTIIDAEENRLVVQQIDYAGKEIDRFTITKTAA